MVGYSKEEKKRRTWLDIVRRRREEEMIGYSQKEKIRRKWLDIARRR